MNKEKERMRDGGRGQSGMKERASEIYESLKKENIGDNYSFYLLM